MVGLRTIDDAKQILRQLPEARRITIIGAGFVGREYPYSAQIAMQNAVEFREVPAIAVGITNPSPEENFEVLTFHQPQKNIYRKLVLKNDVPVGMILVGEIRQAGITASLIRRKRPVTEDLKEKFIYGKLNLGNFLHDGSLSLSLPA